jgi:hypothetical protein
MSTHKCFAANRLNYFKLRLASYELQNSLAVWPTAGQVVPPDLSASCLDLDAVANADLLMDLRYDMCSALMARPRCSAMLNINPGETPGLDQQGEINLCPAYHIRHVKD